MNDPMVPQEAGNPALEQLANMMGGSPPQRGPMSRPGMPPQGGPPQGAPPQEASQTPSMGVLLKMIEQRESERPTRRDQTDALGLYQEAVRNSQPLNDNPFYSLGRGFLSAPAGNSPNETMLLGITAGGQEIVKRNELVRKDTRDREVTAAKLKYDDIVKERDTLDVSIGSLSRGASGGKGGSGGVITRQEVGGPIYIIDKVTGVVIRTIDPTQSREYADLFRTISKEAEDLKTLDPDEKNAWITEKVLKALGDSRRSVGNPNRVPGPVTAPASPMPVPLPSAPDPAPMAGSVPPDRGAESLQLELDTVRKKMVEIKQRPDLSEENKRLAFSDLMQIEKQLVMRIQESKKSSPTPPTNEPPVTKEKLMLRSPQEKAFDTGVGGQEGKHMGDTFVDIQKTGAAAKSLVGDLNLMEKLYTTHGENIPEGYAAPLISGIKSTLKTLGVDVQGQGASDVVAAMATKQALKARTADGENLLPGAMSNYEDRLLQSMSPGLAMTQEGRMLMITIMKAQLNMRSELSGLARDYHKKHGRLDAGWFEVAAEHGKTNPFLNPDRVAAIEEYANRLMAKKGAK